MKIITGMHRTGTSVLARLIYEMGGNFGNHETFFSANKWNPGGYFEQNAVIEINKKIIDGNLGVFSYFFPIKERLLLKRSKKYSREIKSIAKDYENKIVKEPRFCLTLRSWKSNGAKIDKILICFRHPDHVAGSLRRRNHIWAGLSNRLWQEHYHSLLCAAIGTKVWFVNYHKFVSERHFIGEASAAVQFMELNTSKRDLILFYDTVIRPHQENCNNPERISNDLNNVVWENLLRRHGEQNVNQIEI